MWSSNVITWDGNVIPCCFDKDGIHTFGSIKENEKHYLKSFELGNKKPVTVFVFESGKILIMAAKKRENIHITRFKLGPLNVLYSWTSVYLYNKV